MRRRGHGHLPPSGAELGVQARVLGLDPGSVRTGWGVVERQAGGARASAVAAGVLRVADKAPLEQRVLEIHRGLVEVIQRHRPQVVAIEDIFFARYPRAALVLGHARGVALLAVAQAGLPLRAYPPAVVKRSVVGSGRADKRQVSLLVSALLGLSTPPPEDATDALAVALTHVQAARFAR